MNNMRKYKVSAPKNIEVASIWIWEINSIYTIGMIIIVPYLSKNINELYPLNTPDNDIILDLLAKSNLQNCSVK
jgi:hypothetical protein